VYCVFHLRLKADTVLCASAFIERCPSTLVSSSKARWSGNCLHNAYNHTALKSFSKLINLSSYLDKGVELTLKRGDVCVQRGTIHGWENKSDKPARIYFVLTGTFSRIDVIEPLWM